MWRCGEGKTEREGDIRPCMDRGGEPLCTVFWEVIQHIFQISSPHQSSWCACSGAKTAPQPYNNRNGGACFTALRAGANTHNSPLHTPHHSQQPQPPYYTITYAMTWCPERDHGSSQTNACMCSCSSFFPCCKCAVWKLAEFSVL